MYQNGVNVLHPVFLFCPHQRYRLLLIFLSHEHSMTQQGMFLESTQLDLLHAIRRWELDSDPTHLLIAEATLSDLLARDSLFKQWLLKPGYPIAKPGSLRPICNSLAECLLNLPESLAPGLAQCMHQAIQNRQLRHSFAAEIAKAKREMLYHLAYGLSHEINNPLANISTRAQLLMPLAKTEKEKQLLGHIVDQSQRAFEMLGDLMQCAKTPKVQLEWFDGAQLLKTIVESFIQSGMYTVEWIIREPQESILIHSDRDLVVTILEILIQNSLEAIGSQGTIIASLSSSGAHCEFTVQDTGNGLSVDARRHAMNPFYSGRDAGRGIGLGLCKANHFAESLGGELRLEGQTNAGCLANLKLPTSPPQRRDK
jgi:signal transduction histidine kinase